MKTIKVVIGKNFGDEGKGAVTNWLCEGQNTLVVRHNGGAQAGHTVETDTARFIFHQLGSGSFQGCPTFWSHTFLPDLLKLGEEMEDFYHTVKNSSNMFPTNIYAHPSCVCVTVYDVLLNSLRERLRGKNRHGSCGMGIFETVLRTNRRKAILRLHDFQNANLDFILSKLRFIRDYDTNSQLSELRASDPEQFQDPEISQWADLIADDNVLYNAAKEMLENFNRYIILSDWPHIREQFDTVLFENAQGLMLDWDNEAYFPHLTASHTGLKNITSLITDFKEQIHDMEIIYVTRTYVTRHGAGRLDHECTREDINPYMTDFTNLPNPWQGALRYARHPVGTDFFQYIQRDKKHLPQSLFPRTSLLFTHPDETNGKVLFTDQDRTLEEVTAYCRKQAPGLFHRIHYHCFLPLQHK